MLSGDAKKEWVTILIVGLCLAGASLIMDLWWPAVLVAIIALALVLFFRDPDRRIPSYRNVVVAPCDGTVSSVHELERFEPFDGPAVCVRIFMSVFDVHINRCPCHGKVASITEKAGIFRNTLNPEAAEDNQSVTTMLVHPVKNHPVAAVRQIAGLLARTIHNTLRTEQVVQRGQRMGLIKLGSTTELYLPTTLQPDVQVKQGQKVLAGITVLMHVTPLEGDKSTNPLLANLTCEAREVAPGLMVQTSRTAGPNSVFAEEEDAER